MQTGFEIALPLKRQASGTSLASSIWPSTPSVKQTNKRKLKLAGFASIVNQAMEVQNAGPQGRDFSSLLSDSLYA